MSLQAWDDITIPEIEMHLEDWIDKHGLKAILEALEEICYAKAQQWQDVPTAKLWLANATRIARAMEGMKP